MNSLPPPSPKQYLIIAGGLLMLFLAFFFRPFVIINAGQRGVVMKFGKVQERVLDEGIHPVLPVITTVQHLSVRVQKNDINADASSKDLQNVTMEVAVNWHIQPKRAHEVFQRVGNEEQIISRIITPAVSEVVKAATAKKNAEEIITKRTELKEEIDSKLDNRLVGYGIIVDDVSLVNVSFSPEFAKAIEAKQIAEQEAKRAEFEAVRAEKEANAEINRAKGKAEAQRLLQVSLTSAILQQQAIDKWDGSFPTVMGGEGTLPFININAEKLTTPAQPQPQQKP